MYSILYPTFSNVNKLCSYGSSFESVQPVWFTDPAKFDVVVDKSEEMASEEGYKLETRSTVSDAVKGRVPGVSLRKPGPDQWPANPMYDLALRDYFDVPIVESDVPESLEEQLLRFKMAAWKKEGKTAWDGNVDAMALLWCCGFDKEQVLKVKNGFAARKANEAVYAETATYLNIYNETHKTQLTFCHFIMPKLAHLVDGDVHCDMIPFPTDELAGKVFAAAIASDKKSTREARRAAVIATGGFEMPVMKKKKKAAPAQKVDEVRIKASSTGPEVTTQSLPPGPVPPPTPGKAAPSETDRAIPKSGTSETQEVCPSPAEGPTAKPGPKNLQGGTADAAPSPTEDKSGVKETAGGSSMTMLLAGGAPDGVDPNGVGMTVTPAAGSDAAGSAPEQRSSAPKRPTGKRVLPKSLTDATTEVIQTPPGQTSEMSDPTGGHSMAALLGYGAPADVASAAVGAAGSVRAECEATEMNPEKRHAAPKRAQGKRGGKM